ncbi:hypothetical protein TSOC111612_24295 [Tsukamurella ocularis]
MAVVSGTDRARPMPPTKARTSSIATESEVSTCPSGRPAMEKSSSSGSAVPTYANTRVYTVDAMWSRPTRIAERKVRRREDFGESFASSKVAEDCVIVTSLSTPSAPMTKPASSTPEVDTVAAYACRLVVSSLLRPVTWVVAVASQASTPHTASEHSVPNNAAEVRSETPCARYSTR